jgi:hypothetical protein
MLCLQRPPSQLRSRCGPDEGQVSEALVPVGQQG